MAGFGIEEEDLIGLQAEFHGGGGGMGGVLGADDGPDRGILGGRMGADHADVPAHDLHPGERTGEGAVSLQEDALRA